MSGFFANVFSGRSPASAPAAPANQQPGNNQQQKQAPNGTVNNGSQGTQQMPNPNDPGAQQNQNPLDAYSKMFDTVATNADTPPAFVIDPKVMGDVAGAQDFLKGVDPELMQKAQSGDSQAFMQMMQEGMRNVYRTTLEHSGMLTDKFVGARLTHENKGFDGKVKDHLTTSALAKTANFNHPAVKQQLIETARRIQTQNPDMPADQVAEEAKRYITELANAINPKSQDSNQDPNKPQAQETDWDKWFNEGNSQS